MRILSEKQTAEIIGLNVRSLQRKRVDGSGPPFVRLSERRIGYPEDALQDWIRARTVRSTSEPINAA